jgi:hypothetical protein
MDLSGAENSHDLESGDVDIEILPPFSPPLHFSHSSPPTTTTKKISLLLNDDFDQRQQRANSDPIKQQQKLNSFFPFPLELKSSLSKQFKHQSVSELFYCSICFENHAISDAFILSSCASHHSFCLPCMKSFLKIQISDGNLSLFCPLSSPLTPCHGVFSDEEINSLADEGTKEKFHRFKEMKSDPTYRECPKCKTPSHGEGNQIQPEIICSSCQTKYCYLHSNAHPSMSCRDYTRQQLQDEREAQRAIKTITRKCPSCAIPTEKNGGCNHMTCRQCGEVYTQPIHSFFDIVLTPLVCLSVLSRIGVGCVVVIWIPITMKQPISWDVLVNNLLLLHLLLFGLVSLLVVISSLSISFVFFLLSLVSQLFFLSFV